MLNNFKIDFWTLWGITAQGLFFSRFILQWYQSERQGKIVIPVLFWYLSLTGAVMIFVYAFARNDIVFLITGILQTILYSRNLYLSRRMNCKIC